MINEISFSEVYEIILHMDKELVKKIPEKFINFIKQNKKDDYITNIDYTKSINEQEFQRGTRVILSIIYRDYLCSDEKKKELMQNDNIELRKIEEELREKYNPDNLFEKKNIVVEKTKENTECKELVGYKEENFLKRILRKIVSLLKK